MISLKETNLNVKRKPYFGSEYAVMRRTMKTLENCFPVLPVCASGCSLLRKKKAMLNIKLNYMMCHIVTVKEIPSGISKAILPLWINELTELLKSCCHRSHGNFEHTDRKSWGGFHWLIKKIILPSVLYVYCVKAVSMALSRWHLVQI